MFRQPARPALLALVAGATCGLGGCSLVFSSAPGATDAAVDATVDATVDGGTDAATEPDAACVPGEDADGDGIACGIDCDDGDWFRRPDAPWPTFVFEEIGSTSGYFDVEVAEDGELVVLYGVAGGYLRLATRDPSVSTGAWSSSNVVDTAGEPRQIDLAVGPGGALYACYWDVDSEPAPLLAWSEETGSADVIAGALARPGPQCAIAVDGLGVPHIVFHDPAATSVMHTTHVGGEWSEPVSIGLGSEEPSRLSAVAPANGDPLVAFRDDGIEGSGGLLRLGVLAEGSFTPLIALPIQPRHPVLALEGESIHLCFRDTSSDTIRYLRGDQGGSWEDAEEVAGDFAWCSLALGGAGPVVAWDGDPVRAWVSRRTDESGWHSGELSVGIDGEQLTGPRLVRDLRARLHVVVAEDKAGGLWHGVQLESCP